MKIEPASDQTSPSLLERLHDPADRVAQDEFVARYTATIYQWCRKKRLQEADADDVTQGVLVFLLRKMRTFVYDPKRGSFRGWLRTVTQHACADFFDERKRAVAGSGDSRVLDHLQNIASDDLEDTLAAALDREVWELAQARVRLRTTARDWEIFRVLTLEERSGADVAAQFNLPVATVYVVKSRVQAKLKSELLKLQEGEP